MFLNWSENALIEYLATSKTTLLGLRKRTKMVFITMSWLEILENFRTINHINYIMGYKTIKTICKPCLRRTKNKSCSKTPQDVLNCSDFMMLEGKNKMLTKVAWVKSKQTNFHAYISWIYQHPHHDPYTFSTFSLHHSKLSLQMYLILFINHNTTTSASTCASKQPKLKG